MLHNQGLELIGVDSILLSLSLELLNLSLWVQIILILVLVEGRKVVSHGQDSL
jgi:hypothetical protein